MFYFSIFFFWYSSKIKSQSLNSTQLSAVAVLLLLSLNTSIITAYTADAFQLSTFLSHKYLDFLLNAVKYLHWRCFDTMCLSLYLIIYFFFLLSLAFHLYAFYLSKLHSDRSSSCDDNFSNINFLSPSSLTNFPFHLLISTRLFLLMSSAISGS